MIAASITVTRIINDEEIDIDVYLAGQSEHFESPNPLECGEHIADWYVEEPKGFELTKQEEERAMEALEAAI